MSLACPQCGSHNLRYSHLRSISERLWIWFGIRPLRCRDCRLRFIDRTWRISDIRWARCPKCWRQDLARWSREDYHVTAGKSLLLSLGANPFRCEYCRVNFVSFRPRKERFRSLRHRKGSANQAPVEAPAPNGSAAPVLTDPVADAVETDKPLARSTTTGK